VKKDEEAFTSSLFYHFFVIFLTDGLVVRVILWIAAENISPPISEIMRSNTENIRRMNDER